MGRALKYGYTTGACAAAATLGAALLLRDGSPHGAVELPLPAGFSARFVLRDERLADRRASCHVVKDAGDDPDVTHGVEVHAELQRVGGEGLEIVGGTGIGRVTRPGLAVAVGEPAINPVPRAMIAQALRTVFPSGGFRVTLSIPDGAARAARTLNARLGIVGGLSILGTSGVVKPISHQAWTDTLLVAIDVALAGGCRTLVASTGRTSERVAEQALGLPEPAYLMMGDHVGFTLEAAHTKGVPALIVAAQFAKLVKIACGHRQTHVRQSQLDLQQLAAFATESGLDGSLGKRLELANTAREIWERLGPDHPLVNRVAQRALAQLQQWAPGVAVGILLADYHGAVAGRYGAAAAARDA